MRDIHCPKDIGMNNIFSGEDCEREQHFNNCYHCWASAIAQNNQAYFKEKILEQEPIILKANEKKLKELIHDNPLCVAIAEPKTDTLDKIRAEIEEQKSCVALNDDDLFWYKDGLNDAIEIIDKYRQEG